MAPVLPARHAGAILAPTMRPWAPAWGIPAVPSSKQVRTAQAAAGGSASLSADGIEAMYPRRPAVLRAVSTINDSANRAAT